MSMEEKFLSTKELAKRWGISTHTIEAWRTTRYDKPRGPGFIRVGLRKVLYPLGIVEAYEAAQAKTTGQRVIEIMEQARKLELPEFEAWLEGYLGGLK